VLAGGSPLRLIRLSERGAKLVAGWHAGEPLGDGEAPRRLARRLLDSDLVIPDPQPTADLNDVVVVIPVRDSLRELERCLAALRSRGAGAGLLVVDDGSVDAAQVADVAGSHGAVVVRRPRSDGAAAARNTGLAASDRRFIAFVDADVVVDVGCLQRLLAHFRDPRVGAAAPRVMALMENGWLGRYEARYSSLDMGGQPGTVAPGHVVSYVPSTTLMVRRSAVPAGGFDEKLTIGEDIDFVWRINSSGRRVVYDPSATVRHEHRSQLLPFVRRRMTYAGSVGPLAVRHPDATPAMRADKLTAATLALLTAKRPCLATILVAARFVRIRRRLAGHTVAPTPLAAVLSVRLGAGALHAWGHALRRAWSPILLCLAGPRATARILAAAYGVWFLQGDPERRPEDLPIAIMDDAIATVGTWTACWRHRTLRPISVALSGASTNTASRSDPGDT
jgi:mycofactocin system glycosyltransferase